MILIPVHCGTMCVCQSPLLSPGAERERSLCALQVVLQDVAWDEASRAHKRSCRQRLMARHAGLSDLAHKPLFCAETALKVRQIHAPSGCVRSLQRTRRRLGPDLLPTTVPHETCATDGGT